MEANKLFWLSGMVIGTAYITANYSTSYAFNRPIESSIIVLALTSVVVFVVCRLVPLRFLPSIPSSTSSSSYIPIADREASLRKRQERDQKHGSIRAAYRLAVLLRKLGLKTYLSVALCLRVEILRQVINHSQCTRRGLAVFVPAAISLARFSSFNLPQSRWSPKRAQDSPAIWTTLLVVLLSTSCYFALTSPIDSLHSTHVCDHRTVYRILVPMLQFLGTLLDILLAIGLEAVTFGSSTSSGLSKSGQSVSWICFMSWVMLIVAGFNPWISPQYRWWYGQQGSLTYMLPAVTLGMSVAMTATCGLLGLSWLGLVRTFSIILSTSTYTTFALAAIRHSTALSAEPYTNILFFFLACIAMLFTVENRWQSTLITAKSLNTASKSTRAVAGCGIITVMLPVCFLLSARTSIRGHPIDALLDASVAHHDGWLAQATTSSSVSEAARNYRSRYGRDPPPHFDQWYEYATSRGSLVIDDYDNIYFDLLPFWSLAPEEIKARTWEMLANPWNDIEFVKVRNGNVIYREGLPISHQWMLNGTADMLRPFAQWLPDMDIPLNLNDEPRVALPYNDMEVALGTAHQAYTSSGASIGSSFSPDRDWMPLPEQPLIGSRFVERSWQPTWEEFGSIGCPPTSDARKYNPWDVSRICTTCLSKHTSFGLVSNWSASADPCHQPDLAYLHGVYISPAAFKATHELMPVFSQSKIKGYNDIRFPSPWNYVEEAKYSPNSSYPDPPFEEKQNTFFWRGTTSEGFSAFGRGAWQGMTRQRLVWLFNNATSSSDFQTTVLLSEDFEELDVNRRYYAKTIGPVDLHSHLTANIDVHFVKDIARCFGRDCDVQYEEYQPQYTPSIDFQDNWNYKYLMDVDGAGFSGRFIPFLHSHSLVFKAGIFREWWDGRVHAWKHFVPVDIRLVDLPGLLAYFGGWENRRMTSDSQGMVEVLEQPHGSEAKLIAEQGREWAGKVLRKEDMEIYMFRLLLEWGRLTDDRRDELGWRDDL